MTLFISDRKVASLPAEEVKRGHVLIYGVVLEVEHAQPGVDGGPIEFACPGHHTVYARAGEPATVLGRVSEEIVRRIRKVEASS